MTITKKKLEAIEEDYAMAASFSRQGISTMADLERACAAARVAASHVPDLVREVRTLGGPRDDDAFGLRMTAEELVAIRTRANHGGDVKRLLEELVVLREALATIARGDLSPAIEFAQAILDGHTINGAREMERERWNRRFG